jgi:hypothetical protein
MRRASLDFFGQTFAFLNLPSPWAHGRLVSSYWVITAYFFRFVFFWIKKTMKKLNWLLLLLICTLAPSHAWARKSKKSSSRQDASVVFQKRSQDFGEVNQGQVLRQRFYFKNEGSSSLKIQNIEAPCGCTFVYANYKKSYKPQEEGYLDIDFETAHFTGQMEKTVKVFTNDLARPEITLTLKAMVKPEFVANPPVVDFAIIKRGKLPLTKTFVVEPVAGQNFSIDKLIYNESLFKVDYQQKGKKYQFKVTLNSVDKDINTFKEKISILNKSKYLPQLDVFVLGNIEGNIRHDPFYIDFGAIKKNENSLRQINFRGENPFQILPMPHEVTVKNLSALHPEELIETKVDPNDPTAFLVTIKNHAMTSGNVHGKLKFATDDPSQKELKIDFYAYFY